MLLQRIYRGLLQSGGKIFQWASNHQESWLVPLVIFALVLMPLADLLWLPPGQFMGGSEQGNDFSFAMLPWWQFARNSLRQGELPLWNPHLAAGMPFIANPQPAHFYPPVWLIYILPPTRVLDILYVLHLWLAGWGLYVWLRSESASQLGAGFGAAVFAFSGYFFVRLSAGHSDVLMTQAWLPWILWACRQVMTQPGLRPREQGRRALLKISKIMLGGIPIGLSLLAGHTATFFYVGIVLAAYALYTAWIEMASPPFRGGLRGGTIHTFVKALLPVAGMSLVGFALAAVQLVPTFEFLSLSTREDATYAFASGYSWPPGYLITLLVPNFFGNPVTTGYWGDGIYEELIFYVGILPLLLICRLGTRLKHRLTPWLLVLAGAGLLLALGRFGIVHRLAYTLIPLFRMARAPARAGFLFTFAVATLSGLLVTWIEAQAGEALRAQAGEALKDAHWRTAAWIISVIATVVILSGFILFTLQRDSNPEVGRLWHVANSTALFLLCFLLATALISALVNDAFGNDRQKGRLTGKQGAMLAIGLLLFDLWSYGRPLLQAVPVVENKVWKRTADIIQANQRTCPEPVEGSPSGAAYNGRVLPWGLNIFDQNLSMQQGLENIFSYDPMGVARHHRFTTYVADPRARAYDLLGARYLITQQDLDFPDEATSPRLIDKEGSVRVYERPQAMPAAWLVHESEVIADEGALLARLNEPAFDPRQAALLEHEPTCTLGVPTGEESVTVISKRNNRIMLSVNATASGVLILGEIAYPGWRVSIDEKPATLLRADYALRAVCIPEGEHQVTFTFLPTSLLVGAGISFAALILIGWATWLASKKGRANMPSPTKGGG